MTMPITPGLIETLLALARVHSASLVARATRRVLAKKNMSRALPTIGRALKNYQLRRTVLFETAQSLNSRERAVFTRMLSAVWPKRAPIFSTNSNLLGGFRVIVGSQLVDYSLRERLTALQRKLMEVDHVRN